MDIAVLKTFLEVAKRRHFGEAADVLFVSQSTVSARIKALEESLGVTLFDRERGNIHLTDSGEALIVHAKSMLTLWSRAKQEVALPSGTQQTLSIAGLAGLWDIGLQDWLYDLTKSHPHMALSANVYSPETMVRRIMDGTLDLAFLYDAPHGINLVSSPLKTLSLRLVSDKPQAQLDGDWHQYFISVDWGLDFAVQFAAAFPEVQSNRLVTEFSRIAYEHLKRGGGYAYLAENLVAGDVAAGRLHYIKQAPVFQRQAYAIFHEENEKEPLLRTLINDL